MQLKYEFKDHNNEDKILKLIFKLNNNYEL